MKKKGIIISSIIIVLFVVLILFLILFFKNKPKTIKDDNNSSQKIEYVEPKVEEKKLQIIDENSNTRNIAVMINNIKTVWGVQSGIQDAYILYEIITEGGITRLMGVFKDTNTARIGTIRSARAYFLDYALENDAIYVHIGGSPEATEDIKTLGVNDLESAVIWREKNLGLAYEHTAFTSIEKIREKINSRGYRNTSNAKELFNYSVDEINLNEKEGSIQANKVFISFSNSKSTTFEYDSEKKVYKRFQNDVAHKDYVTKEQYTVKNIITYQVANKTYDYKGRQTLYNIGSGTGYYITNGYAIPITWEKKDRKSQTVYKYLNGEEIILNDGNTHIEIQPKNRTLNIN